MNFFVVHVVRVIRRSFNASQDFNGEPEGSKRSGDFLREITAQGHWRRIHLLIEQPGLTLAVELVHPKLERVAAERWRRIIEGVLHRIGGWDNRNARDDRPRGNRSRVGCTGRHDEANQKPDHYSHQLDSLPSRLTGAYQVVRVCPFSI